MIILLSISSVVHSEEDFVTKDIEEGFVAKDIEEDFVTKDIEEGFIVQDIKVTGLQRISVGTVFNYLPVNIGEKLLQKNIAPAIRALFRTGFFQDISMSRQGDVLIIAVQERPSIAEIEFEGNDDLSTEDLLKALTAIGLSQGTVFN